MYDISIEEASKQYREVLKRNIDTLYSLNKDECPNLYKRFQKSGSLRKKLIHLIEDGLSKNTFLWPLKTSNKLHWFASFGHLAEGNEAEVPRWSQHMMLLAAFGLVEKLKIDDKTDEVLTQAAINSLREANFQRQVKGEEKYYPITWYHIPDYDDGALETADWRAEKWNEARIPLARISKNAIIRVFGEETANMACLDDRAISIYEIDSQWQLTEKIEQELEAEGYARPLLIIQKARRKYRKQIERLWGRAKRDILKDLRATYGRPTKAEKEQWKLPDYKYIIKRLPISD